jgi:hypothetical protein
MFYARITPEDGPEGAAIELSGEVVPYDLEMLREHLLQMRCRRGSLHVYLRAAVETHPRIRARLSDLGQQGINLVLQGP